uniref:Uncharacterized protein n=1 Tax=Nicotiana tabacum TaxID=4097 RepID=A0A1S3XEU7_TOBAC|nr:PREDICTED: uncharacterized protein LOC107764302 [Nicotiana tabacum]
MATNDQTSQVQQKVDRIDHLRAELMNEVQAMDDVWKEKMDRLALEIETARKQLTSVEVQLRVAKEKADARARQNEDLQAQLGSAIAKQNSLVKELKIARSELEITKADAEEMVAQYRDNIEAAEARLKVTVEHVKRLSRRETLKEIHARGFDLSAEIEESKRLEVEAKKLAEHEGEEGSEGSEDGEDPDDSGDEAGSGEDQA